MNRIIQDGRKSLRNGDPAGTGKSIGPRAEKLRAELETPPPVPTREHPAPLQMMRGLII
jgi:hypothetical protein